MEGDDEGGVPSMKDTNFSVDVAHDDDSSGTNEETDAEVITKTKVQAWYKVVHLVEGSLLLTLQYEFRLSLYYWVRLKGS